MIGDVIAIADAFKDPRIARKMRHALTPPHPHGGGPNATVKFFGKDLGIVLQMCRPAIAAIDEMVPGFCAWLETTRYIEDRFMLEALFAIVNKLEAMPKPGRRRPLIVAGG